MKRWMPILIALTLIASSLACSITVNVPKVTIGETETITIQEPMPEGAIPARVTLEMGAGELNLSRGDAGLVDGTIRYNVPEWTPEVERDGKNVTISQGRELDLKFPTDDVINTWDLTLGNRQMDLKITAGAYKGTLDFTGIPLTSLQIADGASQAEVRFDELNPVFMERLRYKTGASQVSLLNLGNANTDDIVFEGATGAYTLDFTGSIQRDISVSITSGVSSVEIIIPENVPCRVEISGGLNNISPSGTWNISNNVYEKGGSGPKIEIQISMGLGNLELISR